MPEKHPMREPEIQSVEVIAPRSEALDDGRGERSQWIDLRLRVQNPNATATLHVVASLRRLRYDDATQTLEVDLAEPVETAATPIHKFAPTVVPILPGSSQEIVVSVPVVFQELVPSGGLSAGVRTIDATGTRHVRVRLGHADTPFRAVGSKPGMALVRDITRWQKTTEARFDVEIADVVRRGSERSDQG